MYGRGAAEREPGLRPPRFPSWRTAMESLSACFVRECARLLRDVYCPRLEKAVRTLPAGDLWWRPHEGAISMGTILAHLEGNVRQWILSGLAGEPDGRDRPGEFAAAGGPAEQLLERLRRTVSGAAAVIEGLDGSRLLARVPIQGGERVVAEAVLHVVEHFSWHAGQAVWIAKSRAGPAHGIAFYDEAKINAARNPPGAGLR